MNQNFNGLLIDKEGSIEVEESDEYFKMKEIETVNNHSRKHKVTERLQTNKTLEINVKVNRFSNI